METKEYTAVGDRGYSFCTCRNIFYTNWNNMELDNYNTAYIMNHINPEGCANDHKQQTMEFSKQWDLIKRHHHTAKSFLNIGDYSDATLDYLSTNEWNKMSLTTIDLIDRKSKHELIVGNFETYDFKDRKFDIVFASHVMEHIRNPQQAMAKIRDILNPGGIVFIAMPDTRHINFPDNVMYFPWLVKEHHILWNMYDWVDFVEEETGLYCAYKQSSYDVITKKYTNGVEDVEWIKEFRTIFKKLQ